MRLVYVALAWVAGIIIAAALPALIPLFWLVLMGAFGFLISYARDTRYLGIALILFAFAMGGYRYGFVPQTSPIAQYNDLPAATVEGVIVNEPDYRDDRVQIQVEARTIQYGGTIWETAGRVLVNAEALTQLSYGDLVRITGKINTPPRYDSFSYADYLARQNIFSLMTNTTITVIDHGQGNPFIDQLLAFKGHLKQLINRALPDPEAALLIGILLGNERGIDPHLAEDFQRVGASHVIAISGFNMAIIAGLVLGTLDKLFGEKSWRATVIGIVILVIYTLLVGANAAVVRAAIMSSLLFIARKLERRTYVPASLAFVVLIMSLLNPLVLWDISFQLSFFAVLGLALFTEPLERQFQRALKALFPPTIADICYRFLNEPIIVSIAALIMTLPLIVMYFGRLSLVSLVVNLLIVPVQSLLLLFGGAALLCALVVPQIAQILFWLDMLLLKWTISIVRLFGRLPFADVEFHVATMLIGVFFACVIGGAILHATRPSWASRLVAFIRREPIFTTLCIIGLGLSVLMFSIFKSRPDGQLHIWWLDIGHSNGVLIQTPQGSQILIDGGRFPSRLLTGIGDRMPFYDREIEVMILTQADEFDVGAVPAVLARYQTGIILTSGQPNERPTYRVIEDAIAARDVQIVQAGYRLETSDGVRLEVLHPQGLPDLKANRGDDALVLRLTYDDISFLLPSDLSVAGQQALLDAAQYPLATVMQLPQHGTIHSLSGEFLAETQPQVVVLQYDLTNQRGDPDPTTLMMLEDILLLEAGNESSLHLWTDGNRLWSLSE